MDDKIIDFSKSKELINTYDGAIGKYRILYDGEQYMLKFAEELSFDPKKPLQGSYSNMPTAEYLGCHLFQALDMGAQETVLGTYDGDSVVACKDFIANRPNASNYELVEFKKLETSYVRNPSQLKRTPAYENIIDILQNDDSLSLIRDEAITQYWQMFIGDALIGNFDRHSGNWGYILNHRTNELVEVAPIYDSGSSFYPKLSEKEMVNMLSDKNALRKRILQFPKASITVNGRRLFAHDFLLLPEGKWARLELLNLYPKIRSLNIEEIVAMVPGISSIQKEFYTVLVEMRKNIILQPAYEKALK